MGPPDANGRPSTGLPLAEPAELGFSAERLARIGPAMQAYIDRQLVPGVVTLVARYGRIAHFEAQGLADVEAGTPMATDAIFRIASMTKPITCVAALMLYEEGHFLLDEPISEFLPAFKNPVVAVKGWGAVPAVREITIRDCMTHTAGVSALAYTQIIGKGLSHIVGAAQPVPAASSSALPPVEPGGIAPTVADWVDRLAKMPLNFQPGTSWEYHPGHEVIGVLVERVSGQTLDEFFRQRILDPLGMADTSFYLSEEKLPRLAAGYAVDPTSDGKFGLVDSPATSHRVRGPKTVFSGGGGLLSTAADYARFAQMLLNGGVLDGVRLLSPKTVELMTTNHTGNLNVYLRGPGYGYGLGVSVRTDLAVANAVGSLGQYGWGGAFCTWYFADPEEDLFGLMFTQVRDYIRNPHLLIRSDFERLVYQAIADD